MTQRELLAKVVEDYGTESEMGIKATEMIASIDKKNLGAKKSKNSKTSARYKELEDKIVEVLSTVPVATNGEVAKELGLSTQMLTHRFSTLVENGVLTTVTEKGKKYYSLAETEPTE